MSTGTLFIKCSPPKYTYYFDRYTQSRTSLARGGVKAGDAVTKKFPTSASEAVVSNSTFQIQEETLVASASQEILVQQRKNITKSGINGLQGNEHKTEQKKSQEPVKKGDPSKNGYAVAGFSMVFMPIIGTLVAAFVAPGTGIGIVIGGLGFILGLVFCSIGLKSEKRGLAKAGKKILIFELILAVILVALAVAFISGMHN